MTSNQAILRDWEADMEVRGRTMATINSYRSAIRGFSSTLEDKPWVDVDESDLKRYLVSLRRQTRAAATIKGNFAAVSSLLEYLTYVRLRNDNPVVSFRSRYLDRVATKKGTPEGRKLLSVDEAGVLLRATLDLGTRTLLAVLFKTGIRRDELSNIDVEDIDWKRGSITLKPHPKRTNCVVYFDDETSRLIKRWLVMRYARHGQEGGPLFINQRGGRLGANGIYDAVTRSAQAQGLHNPKGPTRDRFTPHCCRHWFTTHLRRAGMPDHMIAELRGDADARTLDIYTHIDHEELREAYLARIPRLLI